VVKFVRHYLENIERFATTASFDAPNEADRQANAETLQKALAAAEAPAS
jgi:hypothetical protein